MSGGGSRVSIPGSMRKMIQNIKEITGNHSEEEIYAMLKECSMDPNKTVQRLLLQGSRKLADFGGERVEVGRIWWWDELELGNFGEQFVQRLPDKVLVIRVKEEKKAPIHFLVAEPEEKLQGCRDSEGRLITLRSCLATLFFKLTPRNHLMLSHHALF